MELVEKEKKRLKTVLTSVCKARLKEVNNRNKQKTDSKGKDGEKEGKKKEAAELPPLDAFPYFFLSADKLYAWVIVFPPVWWDGGWRPTGRRSPGRCCTRPW